MRRATLDDKKALIDKVSAFIFDCDGVIWRGDSVIDGVPETLDWLRAQVLPAWPSYADLCSFIACQTQCRRRRAVGGRPCS